MLDLRKLNSINIPVMWIDGNLVKVNQPNVGFIEKATAVADDDIAGIVELMAEMLNDNTSGRKFETKEIKRLNMRQLQAIMGEVSDYKNEVDSDPNS